MKIGEMNIPVGLYNVRLTDVELTVEELKEVADLINALIQSATRPVP